MTISELGIFFGLLLFALPVFIIIRFKLNILRRVLVPFAMMLASTCVIASFLYAASATNSILVQCALALVLFVVSSLLTVGKSRTKVSKLFIPVAAGTFAAIVVTVFYALFLVMGLNNPFVPNFFIPFVGIISGSMVGANAKAINVYYSGLKNHSQLYYYLLGNGSSHKEATAYFLRQSLKASIIYIAKQVSAVCLTSAPIILFVAYLCGAGIVTALVLQVVVYLLVLNASLLSIIVSLFVARKYSFDSYERLNPMFRDKHAKAERPAESAAGEEAGNVNEVDVDETSPSGSLSSLSEHGHTDFASQPQAE